MDKQNFNNIEMSKSVCVNAHMFICICVSVCCGVRHFDTEICMHTHMQTSTRKTGQNETDMNTLVTTPH